MIWQMKWCWTNENSLYVANSELACTYTFHCHVLVMCWSCVGHFPLSLLHYENVQDGPSLLGIF